MNKRENQTSSFIRDIIGCLTSPQSSFKLILENPSLMKATALILTIAIIAAWASLNYTSKLPSLEGLLPGQDFPVNPEQLRPALTIMSAVISLTTTLGTWLVGAVLIHGFSRALRGNGTFKSMLILAGYASIPLLIQHVLRLVDSFMITQEALQLATNLQMSAIADAAVGILTIFGIWSMILLIIAARENYKISTAKSSAAIILSFIVLIFISAFLPFM